MSMLSKTILYIENGVGFGGAVISLRTFLEHADRERFQPVLVHSLRDSKFESFQQVAKTVHVPKIGLPAGAVGDIGRKLNVDVLRYARRLVRVARQQRVDLLYLNNDFVTNLAGMIAGRLVGCPVVLHERDIPAPESRFATLTAAWAARYLAISNPVRQALLKIGAPEGRIRMVPEGLDLRLYRPLPEATIAEVRASLDIAPNDKMIVLVGMVMDWKGQHVFIAAAPPVLARCPSARFVIVGECPPGGESYLRKLQSMVSDLGLRGCVSFAGYRNDIPAVMQAADVVVHASTSPEPFGRVIIEGMMMSRPVIATAIGAPPEIIRHGGTGFLVPPADPPALARALIDVLTDASLAQRIGEQACAEVVRRYSIQRHVLLIESVFEEIFWGALPVLSSALAR